MKKETSNEEFINGLVRIAVVTTADAIMEFFEFHSVIRDKQGNILPDAQIDTDMNATNLTKLVYERLAAKGIVFTNPDINP
jgi:hypothetical protein